MRHALKQDEEKYGGLLRLDPPLAVPGVEPRCRMCRLATDFPELSVDVDSHLYNLGTHEVLARALRDQYPAHAVGCKGLANHLKKHVLPHTRQSLQTQLVVDRVFSHIKGEDPIDLAKMLLIELLAVAKLAFIGVVDNDPDTLARMQSQKGRDELDLMRRLVLALASVESASNRNRLVELKVAEQTEAAKAIAVEKVLELIEELKLSADEKALAMQIITGEQQ